MFFFSVFVQDILSHIILRTKGVGDVFLTLSESEVHFSLFAWYFKKLTEQAISKYAATQLPKLT